MRGQERLLELQGIDSAIDRLEARRSRLEAGEDLRVVRAVAEEAESSLGELRLALDQVGRRQTRLEHDVDAMEQKQVIEDKRLYDGSIVNAKELDALQHEIAGLKERRSRAEDELLELMERREELETRATAAEKEAAERRARVDEVGGETVAELDRIASELEERRAGRASIAPQIDEELLELYEDLRAQKKGVGAAALIDGVCQACHEKLSALELDRLKRTEGIKRCEYCRRIVIFA